MTISAKYSFKWKQRCNNFIRSLKFHYICKMLHNNNKDLEHDLLGSLLDDEEEERTSVSAKSMGSTKRVQAFSAPPVFLDLDLKVPLLLICRWTSMSWMSITSTLLTPKIETLRRHFVRKDPRMTIFLIHLVPKPILGSIQLIYLEWAVMKLCFPFTTPHKLPSLTTTNTHRHRSWHHSSSSYQT